MKRSTAITLLILLFILLLATYAAWRTYSRSVAESQGPSAAAKAFMASSSVSFRDSDGNTVALDEYLGSVIVAQAWATWVPDSPASLRDLQQLQDEYQDQDIVILAINRGESPSLARSFLATYDIAGLQVITDDADRYFVNTGGRTMPETIVYDAEGTVVQHIRGKASIEQLRTSIEQALQSEAVD